MKARYRFRCYPRPSQKLALAKLFGCVRVVFNDALAFCISEYKGGKKKPKNAELQKQFITQAKKLNVGKLRVFWSRQLPSEPSSVTIIKDSADLYFLSFVVEIQPEILPQSENSTGIDLGITTFATLSDEQKIEAPKPLQKLFVATANEALTRTQFQQLSIFDLLK